MFPRIIQVISNKEETIPIFYYHSFSDESSTREVVINSVTEAPSLMIAVCSLFPRGSLTVVFSAKIWLELGLSVGCAVVVHPPW
jgi:hypothetical protein